MRSRYSSVQKDFLMRYIPGHTARETASAFSSEFGTCMTPGQAASFAKNHRLHRGTKPGIQKGHPLQRVAFIPWGRIFYLSSLFTDSTTSSLSFLTYVVYASSLPLSSRRILVSALMNLS